MTSGAETHDDETPETIYARALSIDAQCFAAAPPSTYVQYLTDEKIAVLRTSGITALFHGSLTLARSSSLSPRIDVRFIHSTSSGLSSSRPRGRRWAMSALWRRGPRADR